MAEFKNFRFEIDADGIALATWDMPGRSMNVITPEVMDELDADHRRGRRGRRRSRAASSPRARRPSRAAPTSPCCRASARAYEALAREQGEEVAMRVFFEESPQALAALSPARDLRQALRGGDPRRLPRRRVRAGARLPLPRRCPTTTRPASACRRSRSACSPAPAARSASPRLMQTGDALQMLFKGEQIRAADGPQHGPRPCGRAARRDRRAGAKDWIRPAGRP